VVKWVSAVIVSLVLLTGAASARVAAQSEVPPLTLEDVSWFGAADATFGLIADAQGDALDAMANEQPTAQGWWTRLGNDVVVMGAIARSWDSVEQTTGGLADIAVSFNGWVDSIESAADSCLKQVTDRKLLTCLMDQSNTLLASAGFVPAMPKIRDAITSGSVQIVGLATQPAGDTAPTTPVAGTADDGTYTLTGRILLSSDSDSVVSTGGKGTTCYGDHGFDDFYPGQKVVVKDGSGNVLAVELTESELVSAGTSRSLCEFSILVEAIPQERFYVVEISHRDELTYTFDELEEMDWKLDLSIGD